MVQLSAGDFLVDGIAWTDYGADPSPMFAAFQSGEIDTNHETAADNIELAEGLLEYETLSGEEIKQLIAGNKPSRDLGDDTPPSRGSAVPKAGVAGGRRKKGGEPEGGLEPQPQG